MKTIITLNSMGETESAPVIVNVNNVTGCIPLKDEEINETRVYFVKGMFNSVDVLETIEEINNKIEGKVS